MTYRKSDVLNALVDRLWADPTLKQYVKTIHKGWSEKRDLPMPAIIIGAKGTEPLSYELGSREQEKFYFVLRLLIDIKENPDYLVSTASDLGLLDFEAEVKNAIVGTSNDRGISGTALDIEVRTSDPVNEGDTTAWIDVELGVFGRFFMSGQR